jgi:flagellar hook-associated protein 2
LASGFDWSTIVTDLVDADEAAEDPLETQQSTIDSQESDLSAIKTALTNLQADAYTLSNASFFDSRTATTSDSSLATATADAGAATGSYDFDVTQLATTSELEGTTGVSGTLSSTDDVSNLTLSSAPFATAVTAGTFTVNGDQVTVATDDTLQDVFDAISTATDGSVTASYSASTDKITLSSSSAIVLGSETDTSNFLQAAQLSNNDTGTVTSATKLGAVDLTGAADDSNLATTLTDGGSGKGEFTINGVAIDFSASSDSISDILDRINESGAGVTASYDSNTGQFSLADQTTGDMDISVKDVTGNFLAATGLSSGTLSQGNNLLYTVNGGSQLSSQSNTIADTNSGISGLNVTALGKGSFTVNVAADTSTIASAITTFVNDYNTAQALISTDILPTTSSSGTVTAGTLQGDSVVYALNDTLLTMMNSPVSGLSGAIQQIANLGFQSNGDDDLLSTTDTTDLDSALSTNLAAVQSLFSNSTNGLAVQMNSYLTQAVGTSGSLATDLNSLQQQYKSLTDQINTIQAQAEADQTKYTNEFDAMEEAESTINSQMSYLNALFGTSSSSSSSSSSGSSSSSS